ncbi:hypothetical protein BGW36DRAFT_354704 [Talaromyces proteolyticus]|uniref:Glycoside hydrolase family 93 protein n=1 Tax=Talaromyces proteolyticus TaxID=1131652 RepID=A0AAD4L015_9EURO|nr:uncharacterized protein BGW36DRAFT_354704 [Talaromyces proteolyticus]KAH8703276.1 hypothetical protein BGW36DRAFT_354704 [Talaromyces proteolyticus]
MQLLNHLLQALPLAAAAAASSTPKLFSNKTIFTPPSNYTTPRVLYARSVQLANGDLLATWENYSPEPPLVYFPIYSSKDRGYTWTEIARVQDTANDLGLRYQPFLYRLQEPIGRFPADTLLLAGNSIPTDLSSTHIDLYASYDSGFTWEFVSHIAEGGEAEPDNGLTPVWEPFLMTYNGKLICYYSDQRANTTHGQKLVHQVSSDLENWGPVVDDVTMPTYTDRPGMTTVAQLPNGMYIMTYEYGSFFNTSTYTFPVYFRIASNPEEFNSATGNRLIVSNASTEPQSSPYIVWTSHGSDRNGSIIVSCGTHSSVFVNQALGEGEWTEVETPESTSYSRSLRILQEDPKKLLLFGAGLLPPSTNNKVTDSVIDLKAAGV